MTTYDMFVPDDGASDGYGTPIRDERAFARRLLADASLPDALNLPPSRLFLRTSRHGGTVGGWLLRRGELPPELLLLRLQKDESTRGLSVFAWPNNKTSSILLAEAIALEGAFDTDAEMLGLLESYAAEGEDALNCADRNVVLRLAKAGLLSPDAAKRLGEPVERALRQSMESRFPDGEEEENAAGEE